MWLANSADDFYERSQEANMPEETRKVENMQNERKQFEAACNALHLETSPEVAEDVRKKGLAAIEAIELQYSRTKPTQPGWYWSRNEGDRPGEMWEAISRVEWSGVIDQDGAGPDGLVSCWMKAPGILGIMHERDWSDDCEWAGPIPLPSNSDTFRDRNVQQ
jgi:hypothetical protein